MTFNLNKYKKRRFHRNPEINAKIKALFLYYDYQIIHKDLDMNDQLILLDDWINKFEEHELYEVIPSFKLRRDLLLKNINKKSNIKHNIFNVLLKKIWIIVKKIFKTIFFIK